MFLLEFLIFFVMICTVVIEIALAVFFILIKALLELIVGKKGDKNET